jgi:hypothetical protein
MADTIRVEGKAQLDASLARLAFALPQVAPDSAARIIGQAARLNVPKRTGRLASSWNSDSSAGAQSLSFGDSSAPYAGPIHWGVGARVGLRGPHNIRPSRYLTRAIESTQPMWQERYSEEIKSLISKVRGA